MTAPTPNYVFNPTPSSTLPVSLDEDIIVTFRNKVPNSNPVAYQDFPAGTTVSLVISTGGRTDEILAQGVGDVQGSSAACRIPYTVANTLKTGHVWRCVLTLQDSGNTDHLVPINGQIQRFDGTPL